MAYNCDICDMSIDDLVCSTCKTPLVEDSIETDDGSTVLVAKCPSCGGMIKSPQCCNADMNHES